MSEKVTWWMSKNVIFVLMVLATGCVTSSAKINQEAATYSAVSVAHADFMPREGQTFAWYQKPLLENSALPASADFQSQLMALVEAQLEQKGYRMVSEQSAADYVIGAAIVSPSAPANERLKNFFKLFPMQQSRSGDLPEAIAYVGVISPASVAALGSNEKTRDLLWRSSLETQVLGDKLSPEERNGRLEMLCGKLFKRFPPGLAEEGSQ